MLIALMKMLASNVNVGTLLLIRMVMVVIVLILMNAQIRVSKNLLSKRVVSHNS